MIAGVICRNSTMGSFAYKDARQLFTRLVLIAMHDVRVMRCARAATCAAADGVVLMACVFGHAAAAATPSLNTLMADVKNEPQSAHGGSHLGLQVLHAMHGHAPVVAHSSTR
jgi:hypothetical protein